MRRRSQLLDLLDEVGLLVVELLILAAVRVELAEELHQLLLVAQEDVQDGLGLVRVCYKHLRTQQGKVRVLGQALSTVSSHATNTCAHSKWKVSLGTGT